MTRESYGPDSCRGSIRCKDFHQVDGSKSTTFGGTYNCCCCDPCRFVIPVPVDGENIDARLWCCKCIPRGFLLKFIPNGTDACCKTISVPMFVNSIPIDLYHTYSASLFDVEVTVNIGRVITPTGTVSPTPFEKECGWEIIVNSIATGSSVITDSQSFAIDHDITTCLYVPDDALIDLMEIEGPNGCMGHLYLEDIGKSKLPFQFRDEILTYDSHDKFVDISYDPCGLCTSVSRVICVTGYRHKNEGYDHAEFFWFDNLGTGTDVTHSTGTGSGECQRGWAYENSNGDYEYLFLCEDDDGRAVIIPNLETSIPEVYAPVVVDENRLCACHLKEVFNYFDSDIEVSRPFTIRSGFCGCWDFICGTCRCAPNSLCISILMGENSYYANQFASWDSTLKSWIVEGIDGEALTGTGEPFLRFQLGKNEYDQCIITAFLYGSEVNAEPAIFDCGSETIEPRRFSGKSDVLSFLIQGEVEQYNETGSGTSIIPVYITGTSLSSDCDTSSPCTSATPCFEECGSHPSTLNVNIRLYQEQEDISGTQDPLPDASIDVTVVFWQRAVALEGSIHFECGYVGIGPLCDDCSMYVAIDNGQITIMSYPPTNSSCFGPSAWAETMGFVTETCDPYYANIPGHQYSEFIPPSCVGLPGQATTRLEITVTE
jgi:hypothetical protein